MSVPLISVILPVFNGGAYLAQAVESVLTQTLADFELIIINDGSTDNSWEIIQNYAREDGRIKAFSQTNKGLVATLNRGLGKARGAYLARMDSDDICFEHRFAAQAKALDDRPELGVVGGALIGRALEQNMNRNTVDHYRVTVQFDNGGTRQFDYAQAPNVQIGDRVRADGDQLYR